MSVSLVTVIRIDASIGTAMSMGPQFTKLIKEKKSDGISVFMFLVLFIGVGYWVAYGIL